MQAAAGKAAAKQADAFLEPLLTYVDDDSEDGASDVRSRLSVAAAPVTASPAERLKGAAVNVILAGGAAAAVAAMVLSPANAVFVMGAVAVAHAPYAAFKEMRIIKLPALRSLNNVLRNDARDLEEATDELKREIDELRPEAQRAAGAEEELQEATRAQGRNADAMIDLVKENEQVLADMKDNLRQRIVQDVLGLVIRSDEDNDGLFSDKEVHLLAFKIKLQLGVYGVEFDEYKFQKVLRRGSSSMAQAVQITKRLIPDLPEEEEEEDYNEDDYDMFYMSVAGSVANPAAGGTIAHSITRSIVGRPSSRSSELSMSLHVARDPGRTAKPAVSSGSLLRSVKKPTLPPSRELAEERSWLEEAVLMPAVVEAAPGLEHTKERPHTSKEKEEAPLKGSMGAKRSEEAKPRPRRKRDTVFHVWDHLKTATNEALDTVYERSQHSQDKEED